MSTFYKTEPVRADAAQYAPATAGGLRTAQFVVRPSALVSGCFDPARSYIEGDLTVSTGNARFRSRAGALSLIQSYRLKATTSGAVLDENLQAALWYDATARHCHDDAEMETIARHTLANSNLDARSTLVDPVSLAPTATTFRIPLTMLGGILNTGVPSEVAMALMKDGVPIPRVMPVDVGMLGGLTMQLDLQTNPAAVFKERPNTTLGLFNLAAVNIAAATTEMISSSNILAADVLACFPAGAPTTAWISLAVQGGAGPGPAGAIAYGTATTITTTQTPAASTITLTPTANTVATANYTAGGRIQLLPATTSVVVAAADGATSSVSSLVSIRDMTTAAAASIAPVGCIVEVVMCVMAASPDSTTAPTWTFTAFNRHITSHTTSGGTKVAFGLDVPIPATNFTGGGWIRVVDQSPPQSALTYTIENLSLVLAETAPVAKTVVPWTSVSSYTQPTSGLADATFRWNVGYSAARALFARQTTDSSTNVAGVRNNATSYSYLLGGEQIVEGAPIAIGTWLPTPRDQLRRALMAAGLPSKRASFVPDVLACRLAEEGGQGGAEDLTGKSLGLRITSSSAAAGQITLFVAHTRHASIEGGSVAVVM